MTELPKILESIWPYFRRHRSRLFAGIRLGMLYGLSNASFVWATKTLSELVTTRAEAIKTALSQPQSLSPRSPATSSRFDQFKRDIDCWLTGSMDLWLPATRRPIGWCEVVGELLLFPLLRSCYYEGIARCFRG